MLARYEPPVATGVPRHDRDGRSSHALDWPRGCRQLRGSVRRRADGLACRAVLTDRSCHRVRTLAPGAVDQTRDEGFPKLPAAATSFDRFFLTPQANVDPTPADRSRPHGGLVVYQQRSVGTVVGANGSSPTTFGAPEMRSSSGYRSQRSTPPSGVEPG